MVVLEFENRTTGLVAHGGVKRKLGFALECTYRSTNGVGGHILSRLYPPMPLVGARDRGTIGYHNGGLGAELQA